MNNKYDSSKEDKSLKLDLNAYNKKISKCNEAISKVCEKYNIASTLIANKRDIDYFARGYTDIRFLKGWRFKIFGKLVQ
jgi:ribonuclease D